MYVGESCVEGGFEVLEISKPGLPSISLDVMSSNRQYRNGICTNFSTYGIQYCQINAVPMYLEAAVPSDADVVVNVVTHQRNPRKTEVQNVADDNSN